MRVNSAPVQFTDAEFYDEVSEQDREGNASTGYAIAALLMIAGGGIVGFCIHLARWF
jgi:hypothetical protein